MVNPDVNVYTS